MASAHLNKTLGTATNRKKWTWSAWFKRSRSQASVDEALFSSYADASTSWYSRVADNGSSKFEFTEYNGSAYTINLRPINKQRDISGWYHMVIGYDSTQATASNRVKIYINGEQVTTWTNEDYPALNYESGINKNQLHTIGKNTADNTYYFDGSMAHVHFVDGTQYTASTFGETNASTGIWVPKTSPSVTYGNNGFFLKFDNSANMGLDSSGEGNNFTTSGTIIQIKDTPSNVYASGNTLIKGASSQNTGSNINLTATSGQNSWEILSSTFAVNSGKWYAEFKMGSNQVECGIMDIEQMTTSDIYPGSVSRGFGYRNNGDVYKGGSGQSGTFASYTAGDIIGVAMDLTNNKLYLSKNGTWQNSGDPTSGSTGTGALSIDSGYNYCFVFAAYNGNISANFGNGQFGTSNIASAGSNGNGSLFEYDVPTGYYALNTENIGTQS